MPHLKSQNQASPIFGSPIDAETILPRATKYSSVTQCHVREGRLLGAIYGAGPGVCSVTELDRVPS